MVNLFYCLLMLSSVILGILSLVFSKGASLNTIIMVTGSILVIGLSIIGMIKKTSSPGKTIIFIGIFLTIWPIIGLASQYISISLGIWEIILGLSIILAAFIPTQIFRAPFISAIDRSGDTLTTVSNIKCKNDDIVVKAVLLGSMPSTIIIKPEELWKMLGLIENNVLSNMIRLLFIGWKRTRKTTDNK